MNQSISGSASGSTVTNARAIARGRLLGSCWPLMKSSDVSSRASSGVTVANTGTPSDSLLGTAIAPTYTPGNGQPTSSASITKVVRSVMPGQLTLVTGT